MLPFDLNQSLTFPGLFQLDGACTSLSRLYSYMSFLSELFIGRRRQGRLVSWVEKARLDRIRRLLESLRGSSIMSFFCLRKTCRS